MINNSEVTKHWEEAKREIQKNWSRITDDELDKAKNNLSSLATTIQQKYGLSKEQAQERLEQTLTKYSTPQTGGIGTGSGGMGGGKTSSSKYTEERV